MESDNIKRSASIKIPKVTSINNPVEGTSVTPRQRPKGNVVGTGPISLSGQIVGQISGQGSQMQSQNTVGSSVTYVQHIPQSYINQNKQNIQSLPVNTQQSSSFTPVSPHVCTPNQNISFSQPQQVPYGQSPTPLISPSPLTQQSPTTIQDKNYYFESPQHDVKSPTNTTEDNLEALFPPSGKNSIL